MREAAERLSAPARALLAARVVAAFASVLVGMRRRPLPQYVRHLAGRVRAGGRRHPPARLSRAVHRTLRVGGRQPRCLIGALVLFSLMRRQGEPAELVIGLPPNPTDETAHAWVEIDGRDYGPPPGRGACTVLARYPL